MKRNFRCGLPNHVYSRGINGYVIFYTTADCIFYVTLYSCLAKKYPIKTFAFSIMPNHTHSLQVTERKETFIKFNQELTALFTKGYNKKHQRQGSLFQTPFGSAPKVVGKQIRNCFSYINNNGPVGKLSDTILNYKWNLLAYRDVQYPFSKNNHASRKSRRMTRAIKYIDYLYDTSVILDYSLQARIMKGLDMNERKQITDYILYKYNFLDFSGLDYYFGSYQKALIAMEANGGSEHDIREDWEDYSVYVQMSRICMEAGISLEEINFENESEQTLEKLYQKCLSMTTATPAQIRKFLHLAIISYTAENQ